MLLSMTRYMISLSGSNRVNMNVEFYDFDTHTEAINQARQYGIERSREIEYNVNVRVLTVIGTVAECIFEEIITFS